MDSLTLGQRLSDALTSSRRGNVRVYHHGEIQGEHGVTAGADVSLHDTGLIVRRVPDVDGAVVPVQVEQGGRAVIPTCNNGKGKWGLCAKIHDMEEVQSFIQASQSLSTAPTPKEIEIIEFI